MIQPLRTFWKVAAGLPSDSCFALLLGSGPRPGTWNHARRDQSCPRCVVGGSRAVLATPHCWASRSGNRPFSLLQSHGRPSPDVQLEHLQSRGDAGTSALQNENSSPSSYTLGVELSVSPRSLLPPHLRSTLRAWLALQVEGRRHWAPWKLPRGAGPIQIR